MDVIFDLLTSNFCVKCFYINTINTILIIFVLYYHWLRLAEKAAR